MQVCAKSSRESLPRGAGAGAGWGVDKGTVSLQMITVVGVGEHQHVLQDLDQRLYLFSFLEIVQPDYQLLQSFFVLLFAPLTAATGHDGPRSQQAAPPAPRLADPGRDSNAGHWSAAGKHSSLPTAPATRTPHVHPRPPVYEEGGGSPPSAALPSLSPPPLLPPPPPRPQKLAQWPARGSQRLGKARQGASRIGGERQGHSLSRAGQGDRDRGCDCGRPPRALKPTGSQSPSLQGGAQEDTDSADSTVPRPGALQQRVEARSLQLLAAGLARPAWAPSLPRKLWELGRGKNKAASYLPSQE